MVRHVQLERLWPERYFTGLGPKMRREREKELLKRRIVPYSQLRLAKTDTLVTPRKSHWTELFHTTYPGLKFDKNAISRRTGIPRRILDIVYDRGLKAWKTSGSRPGVNPQQWAIARVYKFVLVTKKKAPKEWYATRKDPDNDLRISM